MSPLKSKRVGVWAIVVMATAVMYSRPAAARNGDLSSEFEPNLKYFPSGWEFPSGTAVVQAIQYLLRAHGYAVQIGAVASPWNGEPGHGFNPETRQQLAEFQRSHGLKPTGNMDKPTWEAMIVRLRPGSMGPAVMALQVVLPQPEAERVLNGVFDAHTARAVQKFQRDKGLCPDGTVGPYTWGFLTGVLRSWDCWDKAYRMDTTEVRVRAIQYLLQAWDYPVRADGYFGPETRAQLTQFQRSRGLDPTGGMNDATWESLVVRLKPGSRGSAVRALQELLPHSKERNAFLNGIYNKQTLQALREQWSQHAGGRETDGVIDHDMWAWLFGTARCGLRAE